MALNLNNVTLAGHLTRDPQIRSVGNDRSVTNFGLAINRRFKGADGAQKEETTFVDCEAWGRTAELVAQYLKKGSPAYIEGRLKLDQWEDKEGGGKRSKLLVVADNVQFLGNKGDGEGEAAGGRRATVPADGGADAQPAAPAAAAGGKTGPAPAAADDEPPF